MTDIRDNVEVKIIDNKQTCNDLVYFLEKGVTGLVTLVTDANRYIYLHNMKNRSYTEKEIVDIIEIAKNLHGICYLPDIKTITLNKYFNKTGLNKLNLSDFRIISHNEFSIVYKPKTYSRFQEILLNISF